MIVSRNRSFSHRHGRRERRTKRRTTTTKPLLPSLESIPEEGYLAPDPLQKQQEVKNDLHQLLLKELVQQQRVRHGLPTLQESLYLNAIATHHATRMASRGVVSHSVSSVAELQRSLGSSVVGENVQSGRCLRTMHMETMMVKEDGDDDESARASSINRRNLLAPYYQQFGCGIATSKTSGIIYTCHLFRSATSP